MENFIFCAVRLLFSQHVPSQMFDTFLNTFLESMNLLQQFAWLNKRRISSECFVALVTEIKYSCKYAKGFSKSCLTQNTLYNSGVTAELKN